MRQGLRFYPWVVPLYLSCVTLITLVTAAPAAKYEVIIPEKRTDSGDTRAVCTPASWTAIILFYLTNYMAHAVTVKTSPGENKATVLATYMLAFLFPFSGLSRALEGIFRAGNLSRDPLNTAAHSGALCIIVRGRDWKPVGGASSLELGTGEPLTGAFLKEEWYLARQVVAPYTRIRHWVSKAIMVERLRHELRDEGDSEPDDDQSTDSADSSGSFFLRPRLYNDEVRKRCRDKMDTIRRKSAAQSLFPKWEVEALEYEDLLRYIPQTGVMSREVYGLISLPEGYSLAYLPSSAIVVANTDSEFSGDGDKENTIAMNLGADRNVAKSLVSIIQTLYAAFTLYQSRGQQFHLLGYSASSVTIVPYLIMSIMNFIANIATPNYSGLFLVSSPELLEARQRGGQFDGTVGRIISYEQAISDTLSYKFVKQDTEIVVRVPDFESQNCATAIPNDEANGIGTEVSSTIQISHPAAIAAVPVSSPPQNNISASQERASPKVPEKPLSTLEENDADTTEPVIVIPAYTPFKTSGAIRWTIVQLFGASIIILVLMGGILFAIVGALTKFRSGSQSTTLQRVFTIWWLAEGVMMGFYTTLGWFGISLLSGMRWDGNESKIFMRTYFSVLVGLFVVQFTPAIGGMVVIGQTLARYGSCVGID